MARVNCPNCGTKAIVLSTEKQSLQVTHWYSSCTNIKDCGASFVAVIGFSHYLNPPMATTAQIAQQYLKLLPREQQLDLLHNC